MNATTTAADVEGVLDFFASAPAPVGYRSPASAARPSSA